MNQNKCYNVLIIYDELHNKTTIKNSLRHIEFKLNIIEFKNDTQIFNILNVTNHKYDLIIIESEEKIIELIKNIRKHENKTSPIIVYSFNTAILSISEEYNIKFIQKNNILKLADTAEEIFVNKSALFFMNRLEERLMNTTNLSKLEEKNIILDIFRYMIFKNYNINDSLQFVSQIYNVNINEIVLKWLKPNIKNKAKDYKIAKKLIEEIINTNLISIIDI